ncbi:hypothetical protein [Streptomyces sp. OE57]|uniref:hypothetical protein n=1 Tax=Streptomyces lacaronensis TaxID=3379885 RepID=UPI0039B73710
MDDEEAALALIAHVPGIYYARIKHTLARRHLTLTGDDSQLMAYFTAADIGPEHEFDAETVGAVRQRVERRRMLEWEMTGTVPADSDDADGTDSHRLAGTRARAEQPAEAS